MGEREDRREPPPGYRLNMPRPSAVPSGWWISADTLADHCTGRSREECVAAAWKHYDRIRADERERLARIVEDDASHHGACEEHEDRDACLHLAAWLRSGGGRQRRDD